MRKLLLASFFTFCTISLFAQNEDERLYYIDISVGYSMALPPFSNSSTNTYGLKANNGGSMSFSFNRKISDEWGVMLEVLSSSFKVKESDFLKSDGLNGEVPSKISINPYRSTFFGVGAYRYFPIKKFTLDIKGEVGLDMVDYANQSYISKINGNNFDVSVTSKRSYAPGLLVGGRLKYAISNTIDVGLKVEYGLSHASFKEMSIEAISSSDPSATPTSQSLPKVSKTISYLNTGVTLGVKF